MVKTSSGYQLMIAGGSSLQFGLTAQPLDTAHLWDPKTMQWSTAPKLPYGMLLDMSAVQYGNDKLLFIGGTPNDDNTNYGNKILEYNGLTRSWREWKKGFDQGRRNFVITVIGGNGKLHKKKVFETAIN